MNAFQMQIIAILSGNFSTAGNFSGYNAAGQRLHITGRQMESVDYSPTVAPVFPFYIIAVEREFNVLDTDGKPTDKTFTRLQAGSVFKSKEAAIEAFNRDKVLTIEAAADLKKVATASGLTEADVKALAAASV